MSCYPLQTRTSSRPPLQPKLKIGEPGDRYEREADAVADHVMSMPDGESLRMQPLEEEEEMMQMQPLEEEEEVLMPKLQMQCQDCQKDEGIRLQPKKNKGQISPVIQRSGDGTLYADTSFSNRLQSRSGLGQPLPDSINKDMGGKFGYNFQDVRVHADNEAAQMNRELGARAFTHGRDIYFGADQYNFQSNVGEQLLAHELTHVMQQFEDSEQSNNTIRLDRRTVSGSYQGVASYDRLDQRPRTDRGGTIHYGIVVYIPSRIGERIVNVETVLSCIYGALRLEVSTQQYDRARGLMDQNTSFRNSIWRLLRLQRDRQEISVYIDYERQTDRDYRISSIRLANLLIDFPHPTEEDIWGPEREQRICGPDITASLTAMLGRVESWFNDDDRGTIEKLRSCRGLGLGGLGVFVNPLMAWDTRELFLPNTGWLNTYYQRRLCGSPRDAGCSTDTTRQLCETAGSCGNSVVVGDKCMLAGTANYALFGKMCRLCRDFSGQWNRLYMRAIIDAWKAMEDSTPPKEVASAAYDGTFPVLPAATENRGTCTGRCGLTRGNAFDFIWEPYKPR